MTVVAYKVAPTGEQWLVTRDGEAGMSLSGGLFGFLGFGGGLRPKAPPTRVGYLGICLDSLGDYHLDKSGA